MAEHIPITRLTVSGFKSLAAETHLEVCPLTILAGANSSGKSSMVQPLLLLKQTLEAPYDPGALLLNGAHVQYDHAGQFLRPAEGGFQELMIGVETDDDALTCVFAWDAAQPLRLVKNIRGKKNPVELRPDMSSEEIARTVPRLYQEMVVSSHQKSDYPSYWKPIQKRFIVSSAYKLDVETEADTTLFVLETYGHVSDSIKYIIHVPAFRENPRRYSYTPAAGPQFAGLFTHYHASLIQQWQATSDPRLATLNQALIRLGLAQQIDTELNFGTQLELKIQPPKSSQLNNLADVGFGVSQVLPVLVALLVAQPGQFVYIEQPEVHLHPRAQVALAAEFAAAAKRGVQVVVETHSDLFLLGVQTQIAEGQLPKDLVRLNWFSLEPDGTTRIDTVTPGDDGSYGGWGEDFGEVALHAQNRYLTAAEAHLFK